MEEVELSQYNTKLDWILVMFCFVYFNLFMIYTCFIVSVQFVVVYSSQFLGSYFVILFYT